MTSIMKSTAFSKNCFPFWRDSLIHSTTNALITEVITPAIIVSNMLIAVKQYLREHKNIAFMGEIMGKWRIVVELIVEAEDEEDAVEEFVRKINEIHDNADLYDEVDEIQKLE